jgi:hypothetical protein
MAMSGEKPAYHKSLMAADDKCLLCLVASSKFDVPDLAATSTPLVLHQ